MGDATRHPGRSGIGVMMVIGWLAFQWGMGNDVVLPVVAARVYNSLDTLDGAGEAVVAVAFATVAAGVFWAVTQLIDVVVVLNAFTFAPRLGARLARWVRGRFTIVGYEQMKPTTRWVIAYGAGASVLCMLDALAAGDFKPANRRHIIVNSIALSAGSVAAVVATVTAMTALGRRHPTWRGPAESFADTASTPWTWILLFVTVVIAKRLGRRLTRRTPNPAGR